MVTHEPLVYRGSLEGHNDWVTAIACPTTANSYFISCSRDKKVIAWKFDDENLTSAKATRSLSGHGQVVQDIVISNDGYYGLSGSWDNTLRLWDLETGDCLRRFIGHTDHVTSVSFNSDNRQIVSGSRDRTINLWNTIADCKFTLKNQQHTDWISCVRFSPIENDSRVISCGWDSVTKLWNLNSCDLIKNFNKSTAPLYTLAISPDASIVVTGGRDGCAVFSDFSGDVMIHKFNADNPINSMCFSPTHYWCCMTTDKNIKICDMENHRLLTQLTPKNLKSLNTPNCISSTWTSDGRTLLVGMSDGRILIYSVVLSDDELIV